MRKEGSFMAYFAGLSWHVDGRRTIGQLVIRLRLKHVELKVLFWVSSHLCLSESEGGEARA